MPRTPPSPSPLRHPVNFRIATGRAPACRAPAPPNPTIAELRRDRVSRAHPPPRGALQQSPFSFFGTLALFPALAGTLALYALWADPETLSRQMTDLSIALPHEARSLVTGELGKLAKVSKTASGVGVVLGILLSLFAASSGVVALIQAVNAAYDEKETRGTLTLRWLAFRFAVGISIYVCVAVASIAVLPPLMAHLGLEQATRTSISVLRWPALALGVMVGLALLYRYAPNRTPPKLQWVLVGSVVATTLWLAASLGLSVYVANFANYGNTYGALGAAIVLLLWLYVSSYAIILGAEVNAELEHQTTVDTTIGPERPMGSRFAVAADTLGRPRRGASFGATLKQMLHDLRTPRRDKRRPVA